MEEQTNNQNKIFNIFLLGDIKSEKKNLFQELLQNESEITQPFEIQGEAISMKILEDTPIENIFSTEGESNTSQGILLFYNVTDAESFNQLKETLTKIKEMNKNDIPVNIIGNIPDNSERTVSYDDAKNYSDTCGVKYHEISFENISSNINDIMKDVGEQVLSKVNTGKSTNEETAQNESNEPQNDNEEKKENENNEVNETSNQEANETENQEAKEADNQEANQTEENKEVNQTEENKEENQTEENKEENQTEENKEENQTEENKEENQTEENKEENQTEENKEETQTEENKEENQTEENKVENQTEENKEINQTEENKEVSQTENNEVTENENKEVNETENKEVNQTENNENENLDKKESENVESTQNNENENTQNNEEAQKTENNENENNQENEKEKEEKESIQVEENEQNNENETNENNENGEGEGEGEGDDNKMKKSRSKEDISNVKKKKNLLQIKKQKEDELLEKKLKKEKELQEWYKKKEQESIELKKKKAIEDKIKLKEKIKEDKIIQKQREKEVKEETYNEKKEIVEKSKKEKEEGVLKTSMEKERSKLLLEQTRKTDKENLKKVLFENDLQEKEYLKKMREKFNSPDRATKTDRYDYDYPPNLAQAEKMEVSASQTLKMNKSYRQLGSSTSRSPRKAKTKKSKSLTKSKLMKTQIEKENIEKKIKELNDREEREEKEKIYLEKMKVINELKDNYLNNSNVYRCLCCSKIPIININEFNHQIETICNCNVNFYTKNKNNKFVSSYKYFEENSLDHPLDMNISCKYCKKTISQLQSENLELNFCPICNDIICSKHELIHKNQKHKNIKDLKDKYKTLSMNKNKKLKGKKPVKKKFQPIFKKSRTPKKADAHKAASTRKNVPVTLRGNKYGQKASNDKKDNVALIDNNDEIKILEEEKIPIYLNDSCCIKHKQIFNSYCYNCLKNICSICEEKDHKTHKIVNLKTLMMEEDKLVNIKEALDNDMKNLNIINDYFDKLIERIKDQYLNYFYIKKKEIEIKQKIIQDYEAIKYNYNCIKNLNNIKYINLNNNKDPIITDIENNFNRNTNDDLLSELKLIFNYLNQSSQSTNLINYNKTKKHLIASPNEEISGIIKLDTNDISVSFFNGKLSVYDNEDFNQKLTCKIFDDNEGINYMKQLKNGDLACCGYQKLKFVNLNLSKKTFTIVKELHIDEGSFNIVEELRNHFLITYDTGNKIKLWKKYQLVHETNSDISIDSLLIKNDSSFLTSSYDSRKINLYDINIDETNYININRTSLDNISVKKMVNLNNNYIVVIFEEKDLFKIIFDDKFEESKNEEEAKNKESENGLCLIQVNTNNQLKIVQKIKYNDEGKFYINLINYANDSVLLLNHYGFIELWNFDKINKKMYIINQFKAIDDYFGRIIRNIIFIEDNKEIILQSYKHVFCLLRD